MTTSTSAPTLAVPSAALLRRMAGPGPRYTSYPTADRFDESFGATQFAALLDVRRQAAEGGDCAPLSLYVHVPFCESVCYYCACNKIITKHHAKGAAYVEALETEMALVVDHLGPGRRVSQLHFGGGSPTFLSDAELARTMGAIRRFFHLADDAEVAIEVDPRTVDGARLARLRALGFNRLSFGVQDIDPRVQQAVHRVQPFEAVRDLVGEARALGFASVNVDLIYGLPLQTPQGFADTVARIGGLRADRIALYAYAHLPERFKPQRRIAERDLPDAPQRVAMLEQAMRGFLDQGYDYIGMDHFALPGDPLARARREGRLQRNFQGYSTQPDCDLLGLGVSAIGRLGASYTQNAKTLPEYEAALAAGRLPVVRGRLLAADDLRRRDVIMALMCHGRVAFADIDARHGGDMRADFAPELARLRALAQDGTVQVDEDAVRVTPAGWFVVRAIAMVFDRYLQQDGASRERFSRIA